MSAPNAEIPEALVCHLQIPGGTNAACAFEAVAKLHGLIPPDAFPLQSNPANQRMDFGDPAPLVAFGLQAREDHHSPLQAIELIVGETREGRYPLVCLFAGSAGGTRRWHVFLCARHRSKLLLIDPALGKVRALGRAPIKLLLVRTILATPDRKGIHLMTSRPPAPNRPRGL